MKKSLPVLEMLPATDELYLKIKGDTKYLYALMDDETRFCDSSTGSRYKIMLM